MINSTTYTKKNSNNYNKRTISDHLNFCILFCITKKSKIVVRLIEFKRMKKPFTL